MPELIITVGIRDTQPVIRRAVALGKKHRVQVAYDVSHGSLVNSVRLRYEGGQAERKIWLTTLLEQARFIAARGGEDPQEAGNSRLEVVTGWHWAWICALALLGGIAVALLMEVL
jgi:hypothetical protein